MKQIMKQTIEQTTKELFWIYETLLDLLDECKRNKASTKFSDEVEKKLRDFEEFYPLVASEYRFIHKL